MVVIFRPLVGLLIVIPSPCVVVCGGTSESATCATNEKLPGTVGVPEMMPPVESDNPVGNVPLAKVHV